VREYEARTPDLLEASFPGKAGINKDFRGRIAANQKTMDQIEARQVVLDRRVDRLLEELKKLEEISERDFVAALVDPEQASDKLDEYIRGVFAEWEPMPDWFRDAMAV